MIEDEIARVPRDRALRILRGYMAPHHGATRIKIVGPDLRRASRAAEQLLRHHPKGSVIERTAPGGDHPHPLALSPIGKAGDLRPRGRGPVINLRNFVKARPGDDPTVGQVETAAIQRPAIDHVTVSVIPVMGIHGPLTGHGHRMGTRCAKA